MSFLLILIGAFFTLVAVYLTLQPFLKSREEQARLELIDDEIREVELLLARKEALLRGLRELEFDRGTEKISQEDFERFKIKLERQAMGVMRELDQIHGGRGWRAETEAYVRDHKPMVEKIEKAQKSLECSSCSAPLSLDDRFCAKCGTPVRHELTTRMSQEVPG
jgi:hypothetical protein